MAEPKHFPQHTIDEILLCLPVKSLVRFKSVSKSWSCFISNPEFARNHYKRASSDSSQNIPQKVLISDSNEFHFIDCDTPQFPAPARLYFPPKSTPPLSDHMSDCIKFWGSCNGLICLGIGYPGPSHLVLWNPSTGDSRTVQFVHGREWDFGFRWGFGYDTSDDYKVVFGDDCISKCSIFSLRKNSWRTVETRNSSLFFQGQGVYCNGALYWMDACRPENIIGFDLKEETFLEMSTPDLGSSIINNLFRVKETLCFAASIKPLICFGPEFELWAMEKNEVNELCCSKMVSQPKVIDWSYIFKPFFCIIKGNDFIVPVWNDQYRELIRLDAEGRLLERTKFCNDPIRCNDDRVNIYIQYFGAHRCDAIEYIESLVSPHLPEVKLDE